MVIDHWVVPMSLVVLVALFLIQKHGTASHRHSVRADHGHVVSGARRVWVSTASSDTLKC